ncbi:MAG: class I SAM-dependent methyltransferase [Elusimicrobiota bacterium]
MRGATLEPKTDDIPTIDKYKLYTDAVQQPDRDVVFFRDAFREITGRDPKVLREDFCGTFRVCCEWAKLDPEHVAHGLDLDWEPAAYGRRMYLPRLTPAQRRRVRIRRKNVLDPDVPSADLIVALNFSYYIFKKRAELKAYLENCARTLPEGGLLFLDSFGGSDCHGPIEDSTRHRDFTYYWDQDDFDPIHNTARFFIHFRPKGGEKIERVFTYDWRIWTIPEVRELMEESGFRRSYVYWEGTQGEQGNGVFTRTEEGESCEAWIAYIVGER